jgi:hypothetical protein
MRITRLTTPLLIMLLLPAALWAQAPADKLASARAEITSGHPYAADALLQEVVDSEDAGMAQVEEALCLQTMIYYGDVFGAALVMGPLGTASSEPSELKAQISQQLLLARRAFLAAGSNYLNTTVRGTLLAQLKLELPAFSESDIDKINSTLSSKEALQKILADFPKDPSAGQGLLAKANQFGLYLGFSSTVPKTAGRKMADVRQQLNSGVVFKQASYLDWMATVALDMNSLVNEPGGPDLKGLARRADERLLKLVEPDSQYAKNARQRAAKY